jgi:hypothetical protein
MHVAHRQHARQLPLYRQRQVDYRVEDAAALGSHDRSGLRALDPVSISSSESGSSIVSLLVSWGGDVAGGLERGKGRRGAEAPLDVRAVTADGTGATIEGSSGATAASSRPRTRVTSASSVASPQRVRTSLSWRDNYGHSQTVFPCSQLCPGAQSASELQAKKHILCWQRMSNGQSLLL